MDYNQIENEKVLSRSIGRMRGKMRDNPRPQEIYRHFKGNLYQILSLAEHTETGETLVIYQALYGEFKIYARELSMFLSETDTKKYPDAGQKYRFEKIEAGMLAKEQKTENAVVTKQEKEVQEERIEIKRTEESAESEEILDIDPLVMEFLDADNYEERLNILAALHCRITNEMINTMAVAVDLEINEGSIEERYEALKNCLLTLEKYECNRLR